MHWCRSEPHRAACESKPSFECGPHPEGNRRGHPRQEFNLSIFRASTRQEIDAVFEAFARDRPDALFVSSDTLFSSRRVQLVTLTVRHGIPAAFRIAIC